MDFDELRRLHRIVAGDIGDNMARRMRDLDSMATRTFREMNAASRLQEAADSVTRTFRETNAASHLQEATDSATRSFREMNAASHLQETVANAARTIQGGLDLREMDLVTGGLYDHAHKYIDLEDSIHRQLRQHLQDFERTGITAAIRQFAGANEDWRRAVGEMGEQLSSAFALARSGDFEEVSRRAAEMLTGLTAGSAVFGMLARELARSASVGALTPALAGGFSAELLGYIEGVETADSEEAAERNFEKFINWIWEQAQRLPARKLTKRALLALLGLILAAIIEPKIEQWVYGDAQGEVVREAKQEARQARRASEATLRKLEELEAKVDQAQAQDDDAKEYVVVKAAKLRKGPGREFESLQVLPPNVQVEELGREEEWMHVEYFDYAEGELREGWISAELLVEKRDNDQH